MQEKDIINHILQFEEKIPIAVFLRYPSNAQNENFLYIPIVNLPVFWNDHKKEPVCRFSRNFVINLSWCKMSLV